MRDTALKTVLIEEEIAMEQALLKQLEEMGKLTPETALVFETNIESLSYIVENENGLAI